MKVMVKDSLEGEGSVDWEELLDGITVTLYLIDIEVSLIGISKELGYVLGIFPIGECDNRHCGIGWIIWDSVGGGSPDVSELVCKSLSGELGGEFDEGVVDMFGRGWRS